jgi:hypothetical protein
MNPMYLLERKGKYLNERYKWGFLPYAFPEWQFVDVLPMAMNFKDRPLQVGEVLPDGTIKFTEV